MAGRLAVHVARAGWPAVAMGRHRVPRRAGMPVATVMAAPARSLAASAPALSSYRDRKRRAMKKAGGGKAIARTKNVSAEEAKNREQSVNDLRLARDSPGQVMDPYVPIPVEIRPSIFSIEGVRLKWLAIKKTVSSTMAVAVIKRNCAEGFDAVAFAYDAQDTYVNAHAALFSDNKRELRELVTDELNLTLRRGYNKEKHKWKFVDEVVRPRVVHIAASNVEQKNNYWAQVTVRLHLELRQDVDTSKIGGEQGDHFRVLEYIILERHVSKATSTWRVCSKMKPSFLQEELAHMNQRVTD